MREAVSSDITEAGLNEAAWLVFGRVKPEGRLMARPRARIFGLRKLSPQALSETARARWQNEHALHWQLDVSFGEDAARNRKEIGPANIAVLRRRGLDVARLD